MISLIQLAKSFENKLNSNLNNSEIQFRIWANAGEHVKPLRDGNTITHYLDGNLRMNASATDANFLEMGVNSMTLEIAVPIRQPRTNAEQTEAELAKIKDGQYPFIAYIIQAINDTFKSAYAYTEKDENNVQFTIGIQAGMALGGTVDLAAELGNYIVVSVFIEAYFIEGGINSFDTVIYVHGVKTPFTQIPYTALRLGRSAVVDSDVYAGDNSFISKNFTTSTAFAIDVDFPATDFGAFSQYCSRYLLEGTPNDVIFVDLDGKNKGSYLMTLNSVQSSAVGVTGLGWTVSLMQTLDKLTAVNISDGYQLGRAILDGSESVAVQLGANVDCKAFIAGKTLDLVSGEIITVDLQASDIEYDEDNDSYCVYALTNKSARLSFTLQGASLKFEIVKGARNG